MWDVELLTDHILIFNNKRENKNAQVIQLYLNTHTDTYRYRKFQNTDTAEQHK